MIKNASPERLILLGALVVFTLTAAYLAFSFPSEADITGVSSVQPIGKVPPRFNQEELDARLQPLLHPAAWKTPENRHPLFISSGFLFYPSLFPAGNYLQPDNGKARTPGGVLISWYRNYRLDFTDPNIDRLDPDNDGFSNKVEFANETAAASEADGTKATNPLDPQSHPTYLSRLRLQNYDRREFRLQFRGYQPVNGTPSFQIYLKNVPSASQPRLKKTGDDLGFEGYKVGEFHEKISSRLDPNTKTTVEVNESTLELIKPNIDFKIVLIYRQEVDSPESTANFVMLMPSETGKVIKVARGASFQVPYLGDTKYLVVEVREDGAKIRSSQSQQEIAVPHLDPTEWDLVPAAPSPPAAAGKVP